MRASLEARFPHWIWEYPRVASKMTGNIGRGFLVGLGLVMALAALKEIWELVDIILLKYLNDRERQR